MGFGGWIVAVGGLAVGAAAGGAADSFVLAVGAFFDCCPCVAEGACVCVEVEGGRELREGVLILN